MEKTAAGLYEKIRTMVFDRVLKLEAARIDTLLFWRVHVLFSILYAAVFIGFWALLVALPLMMEKQLWGLLCVDAGLWVLTILLAVVPGPGFRVRTAVVLAAAYGLGLAVILNVGLLSGGPVALFTFSVLAGVLMGAVPALASVLINAATLSLLCVLRNKGIWGADFPFFDSTAAMVTAGANYILLNALASVSVSVLLAGLASSNRKEKALADSLLLEKKKLLATQGTLENEIREHQKTGEALRESERKYRQLFNNAPVGMYEIDFIRHRFVTVNDKLCDDTGYSREVFLAKDPVSFLTPAGMKKFSDRVERLMRGESVSPETEYEMRHKDGRVIPVLLSNDYVFKEGKLVGARVVVQDLTERKKMEEMMIQNEKMLSVGGLAAGMAHEINNPLAGILQNAQVIENRLTQNLPANDQAAARLGTSMAVIQRFMEERRVLKQLARIREAGEQAAGIVDNMLSFAQNETGKKKQEDLSAIIEKTIALASSEYDLKQKYELKNIPIDREYDPATPPVLCEKSKIQQVIFNIIKNGCQAMAGDRQAAPRFTFRIGPAGDMVRLEIADNGPGMDGEIRKRIFEPFFTTKEVGTGTGLGLSVSYFIVVEDHGGDMRVESAPGEGSRFIIKLPRWSGED